MKYSIIFIIFIFMISACSLAPEYKAPKVEVPEVFKEESNDTADDQYLWQPVESLEKIDRGQWWKIFNQADLNALEKQAIESNQSLKVIAARVEQSRDIARANKGGFLPDIDFGGNVVRSKPSAPSLAAFGAPANTPTNPYTLYNSQASISYEADIFGRVRDTYKASVLDAEAQSSLYQSALLSLQADVAQNYFSIRALDSERKLLRNTVKIRSEAARIMQRKFKEGDAGEQDQARTQSELASVEADLIAVIRQRTNLEHALAVLLGKIPSNFVFAEAPLEDMMPVAIPAGLPSDLLKRRPDVLAAIDAMRAANSRIGVAKTAYFPSITLTASGGFQSNSLSDIFNWSGRTWALGQVAGNALSLPIFHGGRDYANVKAAKSAFDEAVANYREQVLIAFREVEDSLVDQRLLAKQSVKEDRAATTASRTTDLAKKRYHEGETDYFEVVDSERISLAAERSAVQIRGQRFITTVSLIRALGGGWGNL